MNKKSASTTVFTSKNDKIITKKLSKEEAKDVPRLRINFVTPGTSFSNKFLGCWTTLLDWSKTTNLDFVLVSVTGSNINHVREMSLMGDINGDEHQKPFKGEPYNYILFCDSDQLFTPQDIDLLLKANKDIISGAIKMIDGCYAQGWYDREYYLRTKTTYRLIDHILDSIDEPFRVSLLGCGFTLVKHGIIEQLKFPWFKPLSYPEPMVGYFGEDMSLFLRIQRLGYQCWLHPKVRIKHEKKLEI